MLDAGVSTNGRESHEPRRGRLAKLNRPSEVPQETTPTIFAFHIT